MPFPDCPEFNYERHKDRRKILRPVTKEILGELYSRELTCDLLHDCRHIHKRLFEPFAPQECPYYAGHYRGERFRCLCDRMVGILGAPNVGALPDKVEFQMLSLEEQTKEALQYLDEMHKFQRPWNREETIQLAADLMYKFLMIHPYINGNGHISRIRLTALLIRYGYNPMQLSIEPRPDDPEYLDAISDYHSDPSRFRKYVEKCLKRRPFWQFW